MADAEVGASSGGGGGGSGGPAAGRPRAGRFLATKRSFHMPAQMTVKTFAVQQHAAGTKGVRRGQLILELEAGVLVIQRSGKLRRTAVEHIRHMVVRPDPRTQSTSGSATLELQFDYNGQDSAQGRSIKVFDFENGSSRENFQRLVLALLFCREAMAPIFDVRNGFLRLGGDGGDGGDPSVSVGTILQRVFHKKDTGLSTSTATALLSYEDALLFCFQEIENQGMSLRPPFLMLRTELIEYQPQTCDVMLSCMLGGEVCKIPVYGRLYLTNFRLVFMPHFCTYAERNVKAFPFQMPLQSLVAAKLVDGGAVIAAQTKTLRSLKFTLSDAANAVALFQKIVALTFNPPTATDSFAFAQSHICNRPGVLPGAAAGTSRGLGSGGSGGGGDGGGASASGRPRPPVAPPKRAVGWRETYTEAAEFARQDALGGTSPWCLYDNSDFQSLPSYPAFVLLPRPELFTELALRGVMAFRSKRRIPAIVWVHPTNHRVIARCSMPLVGVSKKNSADDEQLLEVFRCGGNVVAKRGVFGALNLVADRSEAGKKIYIFDARPTLNSTATRLTGGGQEDAGRYHEAVVVNLDIGNIHVMRNSLTALARSCENLGDSDAGTARADWLHHLHLILKGATHIARVVSVEKCSAVVHCSDGWDRTPQLTATAQLLLDPFYRTFAGFAVLVEKEWCSFGHKFDQRHAHGEAPKHAREDDVDTRGSQRYFSNAKECSPVFVQWLDACHQLLAQFPGSFEFSDGLLLFLAEHVHSCRFGNFLCDTAAARAQTGVYALCENVWEYLATPQARANFANPRFQEFPEPLWPLTNQIQMRLWHAYFSRLETRQIPAPLPEVHERINIVAPGEEWLVEHHFKRFPEDVLARLPRGPACKVRVRRLVGAAPTWNDCWGMTIRNNQIHLYRRSDFAGMDLDEITAYEPHVAIDLDAVDQVEDLRQEDVDAAEAATLQRLKKISEAVDMFAHSLSPTRRGGGGGAGGGGGGGNGLGGLGMPPPPRSLTDSVVVRCQSAVPGPDWCIQFQGLTAFEFWKRYIDHTMKGVHFLRMVDRGQLQPDEYEAIMKKNADYIGLSEALAGLKPFAAADAAAAAAAADADDDRDTAETELCDGLDDGLGGARKSAPAEEPCPLPCI